MNDKAPTTKAPRRQPRNAMISVKLTDEEKKALDKLAFDQDDSVSRLIRQALLKTHPEIFDR